MSRPIRSAVENVTSQVPEGPLGFVGNGNVVGFAGVAGISLVRTLVPGSELNPGYRVRSHDIKKSGETERHTFEIEAYSKDVAKAVARLRAAPSTADYAIRESKIINIIEANPRSTASMWKIVVQSQDRTLREDNG